MKEHARPPLRTTALTILLSALLFGCQREWPQADPALLAALDKQVMPNTTRPVSDGQLVTGIYFIVDSGFGYARMQHGERLYVDPAPIITAGNLQDVYTEGNDYGEQVVSFTMDTLGAALWQVATRKSVNKRIGIVIRDVMISSPTVLEEIPGGRASFAPGMNSSTKAEDFARLLEEDRATVPPVR